jgi:hypothetical protein
MRRALILVLLVLVAAACDSNYDPPSAYGVAPGYGSNGRAYAAQQSPSIFVFVDIVEEEDVPKRAGDTDTSLDSTSILSEVVEGCIAEWGDPFKPWCLCLEDSDEIDCTCEHIICAVDSPDPSQIDGLLTECTQLFLSEETPDKLLGACAPAE